jgi:hypothetical protein
VDLESAVLERHAGLVLFGIEEKGQHIGQPERDQCVEPPPEACAAPGEFSARPFRTGETRLRGHPRKLKLDAHEPRGLMSAR